MGDKTNFPDSRDQRKKDNNKASVGDRTSK